jgi:hypothetical protein
VSHRPLAIVSGLTIGDYLLWNWSLNGSHDVLALVSGLTLPPLAAAFVWLIALTAVRLLGRATRRSPARPNAATASTASTARAPKQSRAIARSRRAVRRAAAASTSPSRRPDSQRPSRKLAA